MRTKDSFPCDIGVTFGFAKVVEYWPPLSLRVCGLDSVSVHRYAKKMSLKKKKNWIARARVAQTTLPIALM